MSPGRYKKYETPEELWIAFTMYQQWAHNHPWYKNEAIKSGHRAGEIISIPNERPLTEWEFACFIGLSYQGFWSYGNRKGYEAFYKVYARIKNAISAQRITGGLVDAYNASLVARLDNITEKSEVIQRNIEETDIDFSKVPEGKLDEFIELLDKAKKRRG